MRTILAAAFLLTFPGAHFMTVNGNIFVCEWATSPTTQHQINIPRSGQSDQAWLGVIQAQVYGDFQTSPPLLTVPGQITCSYEGASPHRFCTFYSGSVADPTGSAWMYATEQAITDQFTNNPPDFP